MAEFLYEMTRMSDCVDRCFNAGDSRAFDLRLCPVVARGTAMFYAAASSFFSRAVSETITFSVYTIYHSFCGAMSICVYASALL